MNWTFLSLAAALTWLGILLLPWRPWDSREVLEACPDAPEADLSEVTVLIPARNEAELIGTTLAGLNAQGHRLKIVLVDDQSTDDTAEIARASGIEDLRIIPGEPRPSGWSGKLWALEQGMRYVATPLVLLIDADIELQPGILPTLLRKMETRGVPFISLMAALRMATFWERLLMPAFIYFFKMVYPFRLSNSRFTGVAAAAGGCILLQRRLLDEIGGFKALRGELIDDCALARRVKSLGCRIWIGLTHSVVSRRAYARLTSIWNMVARTAFTQLGYSTLLLVLVTAVMAMMFGLPVAGLFFSGNAAKFLSAGALGAMFLSYRPTLKFYGRSTRWAAAMPLIGILYLAMTWTSAIRAWSGEGAEWKGRSYPKFKGIANAPHFLRARKKR